MTDIVKSFGSQRVLNGLNLAARPGRVYALLGPNGAGKSTTLAIALGLTRPDAGGVEILDRPWTRRSLEHVGASLNGPAFFPQLSARRNLLVHARLTGTDPAAITPLLEHVGLGGAGRKRAKSFSTGMKVRLALAMALLTDPEVLILDEPQNGLDPGHHRAAGPAAVAGRRRAHGGRLQPPAGRDGAHGRRRRRPGGGPPGLRGPAVRARPPR